MAAWVETLSLLMMIKTLDSRRLEASVGGFNPGDVRRLIMDEFELYKGHRYATVIMDAERTRVLRVGEGNSRQAIRPFVEQQGERCRQIEAVVINMNTAFYQEAHRYCLYAEVVFDLFHVVDRTCVDQANAFKADKPAR